MSILQHIVKIPVNNLPGAELEFVRFHVSFTIALSL